MSTKWHETNGGRVDDGRGMATPPGVPDKPDWIAAKPVASKAWDLILEELQEVPGLLSRLDAGALAIYADAWQTYRDASALIAEHGMVATSEKGGSYQHPAVGIRNKAIDTICKVGSRFGLDPQSREGLIVSGPTADDEIEALLR